jgi:hypothetical protein
MPSFHDMSICPNSLNFIFPPWTNGNVHGWTYVQPSSIFFSTRWTKLVPVQVQVQFFWICFGQTLSPSLCGGHVPINGVVSRFLFLWGFLFGECSFDFGGVSWGSVCVPMSTRGACVRVCFCVCCLSFYLSLPLVFSLVSFSWDLWGVRTRDRAFPSECPWQFLRVGQPLSLSLSEWMNYIIEPKIQPGWV